MTVNGLIMHWLTTCLCPMGQDTPQELHGAGLLLTDKQRRPVADKSHSMHNAPKAQKAIEDG